MFKDISSAPIDGCDILLFDKEYGSYVGKWNGAINPKEKFQEWVDDHGQSRNPILWDHIPQPSKIRILIAQFSKK